MANKVHNQRDRGASRNAGMVHAHPCDGCTQADRCRAGLACSALSLFISTGRISTAAPRQPNREVYLRLYPEGAAAV